MKNNKMLELLDDELILLIKSTEVLLTAV